MSEEFPLITVVTPSYNQAAYLETTILSVLGQCYPRIEYIVMDGGSTDGSVEIIKRYESKIAYWVSQPDGGQSAAINAGFARATGDILCWLNSDDFFLPGALLTAAKRLSGSDDLIYGDCLSFTQHGDGSKLHRPPQFDPALLGISDYIVQPSTFWKRSLWEKTGPLNERLHYAFDWEWFLRASRHGQFRKCDEILSAYRFHDAHKSSSGGEKRKNEVSEVAQAQGGPVAKGYYEFVLKHYDTLKRVEDLRLRLAGRGLRKSDELCVVPYPSLWRLPEGITWAGIRHCLGMLG